MNTYITKINTLLMINTIMVYKTKKENDNKIVYLKSKIRNTNFHNDTEVMEIKN